MSPFILKKGVACYNKIYAKEALSERDASVSSLSSQENSRPKGKESKVVDFFHLYFTHGYNFRGNICV